MRLQEDWLPIFGMDVEQLRPGQAAVLDRSATGSPVNHIDEIPPGDYYVQAVMNVYTQFRRADGHVIWAHMDQWEGQNWRRSPGNLYSKTRKIRLTNSPGRPIKLNLTEVIPPLLPAVDTEWVRHVKIQSQILTKFWGRPMYLGAVVLLPRGYDSHPNTSYPVVYQQGHFSKGAAPFNFQVDKPPEDTYVRERREKLGYETGHEFYLGWQADNFPRMIAVTFLHPTPFYDDSYAVNSANNGPYGDAIMTELIPQIESQFRIIREPYARILTGKSTGGWESLALQLQHPDFFGGTWAFCPDPIDFRRYGLINLYDDKNAYFYPPVNDGDPQGWLSSARYFARSDEDQPLITVQQFSKYEAALGSKGRSGEQLGAFEATFDPVGEDGYPKPIWDKTTGKIDHSVTEYMRDHGYDLRSYAEKNWGLIGPKLVGKLHIYSGDTDNLYLNLGVELMGEFLKTRANPQYNGTLEIGQGGKVHGWQPTTNAEILRSIADYITQHSPEDASSQWKYN